MSHRIDLQMVARTDHHLAIVALENLEPAGIMRGGPLTVRAAAPTGKKGQVVLRGKWSDCDGITQPDRATGVTKDLTDGQFAAIEVALHDAATEEIAASRVARQHRLSHGQAYCVLHALIGKEGPDVWEAVGCRPQCLSNWTDPETDDRLAGVTGWVFWWEESQAAISVAGGVVSHHDGVANVQEAVAMAAGFLRCQCGEVTQVKCTRFRKRGEMMVVEWMPYHLRASHEAAGNRGEYPGNGALRLLCCIQCGTAMLENEQGWARMHKGDE